MLYIGTLDDKALEYPFGAAPALSQVEDAYILFHALFSKTPVIQEGFVLASREATDPTARRVFLPAIRSGLFKVISRTGDLKRYAARRRRLGHKGPPDTASGAAYLQELQNACEQADAFLAYPASDFLDELTFERLQQRLQSSATSNLLDLAETSLPKDFQDRFENKYLTGRDGGRWSARAAFEASLKACIKQPNLLHALMCEANRERQAVRAAALAASLDQEMEVETGLGSGATDLLGHTTPARANQRPTFPSLNTTRLIDNLEAVLAAVGPGGPAEASRRLFLDTHEFWRTGQADDRSLEVAAEDYERNLRPHMRAAPVSDAIRSSAPIVTAFGAGTATAAALNALIAAARGPDFRPIQSRRLKSRLITRRAFGFGVLASVTLCYPFASHGSSSFAARCADGIGEAMTETTSDWAELLASPGISLARAKITPQAARNILGQKL